VEGVRPAEETDVARLAELCRQAQAEMSTGRGGAVFVAREARPEPVDESILAAIRDAAHRVWAGTIDDAVIGYAVARVEPLRTGVNLGVIEDIYVETEGRAIGVGEALMGAALEWFSAEGCKGVDAYALPGDRHTKNFFEGSGFSARLLVMHHRFDR
jgi:GNAT superfamily N-acetyltransferase